MKTDVILHYAEEVASSILNEGRSKKISARDLYTVSVLVERMLSTILFDDDDIRRETLFEADATFKALTARLTEN